MGKGKQVELPLSLRFLGGVGTVTGSKFLLKSHDIALLVDCGLFQGYKQLRLRNWAPFPVRPGDIDTVVLTHAHLDHSGYLPLLVKQGFKGRVLSTPATSDLCGILLRDCAHLFEKDAEFANRQGYSKHKPALPLYTVDDAEKSLTRFTEIGFNTEHKLGDAASVFFQPAGHILGAAVVHVNIEGQSIVFSGDLGRANGPVMPDPATIEAADYLVVESTYGDRLHDPADAEEALADIITKTAQRGGTVIVPAFAVGRTQLLLYYLSRLKAKKCIPELPIFLDSPMAQNATEIFARHKADHKLSDDACAAACSVAHFVRDPEESKALDENPMPKVIVSASGMATGGRILHHLRSYAPDPRNTILFTGFQAGGTRGHAMMQGAASVKIHGRHIPIRADVKSLDMLSAHADADGILDWLGQFREAPKTTFIAHGEPGASDALRLRIQEELGWNCHVPEQGEEIAL